MQVIAGFLMLIGFAGLATESVARSLFAPATPRAVRDNGARNRIVP